MTEYVTFIHDESFCNYMNTRQSTNSQSDLVSWQHWSSSRAFDLTGF